MLYEFIATHRDAIVARSHRKVHERSWSGSPLEALEGGVPLFLTQLSETLRWETTSTPFAPSAIGAAAARHGADLLSRGMNISQVVHTYGDICQAITELAVQLAIPITTEEFHTLNRCLDTAIAEAVTEHARITAEAAARNEVERIGQVSHEIRNMLSTAILAFHTLKQGTVAINGSTGAVLGRTLMGLRDFVDSTLSDVRLAANQHRRERMLVTTFLTDIVLACGLTAEYRGMRFDVTPVEPTLEIDIDPQLLGSAVTNVLNNAFKYSAAGGHVVLRTSAESGRVKIEVEDECGGLSEPVVDPFKPFGERRGRDRTGLGLGLSIARKAVRAHGGDIYTRNIPGHGCVFVIDIPAAALVEAGENA